MEYKVNVTDEAKVDYGMIFCNGKMPEKDIKEQCEIAIEIKHGERRLERDEYFKMKYLDEEQDKMLLMFFSKGECNGKTQEYNIIGVCLEEDYTEEDERDGTVRDWLKFKVKPFKSVNGSISFNEWKNQRSELWT